jgi:FAS-associated factor 2
MKRREEERRKVEEQERKRLEEEDRVNQERKRIIWRRYARRTMLPKEAPMSSSSSVRIGIRLPSGERAIRRFNPTDSVTSLYVFVDSQFLPSDMTPETDPDQPPEGFPAEPTEGTWDFRLAVSFPRGQVDWAADKQIGEIPILKGGANLVVELLRPVIDGSSSEEEEE